ncbi:MAG: glycine zipper 2TM domain-containing protein [Spongiibacteraceae bacterium]
MNKSMLVGTVLGAVAVTAGGAVAGYKLLDQSPKYAEVLEVKPITETIRIPREECHDEQVTHTKPVKDQHRIAGTAIGAVLGGVLGNQVGGGSGKKIATVAGAAAGGYAGNKTQENMQQGDTYTTTERRCQTVHDKQQKTVGYNVKYKIKDEIGTVKMDREPGDKIPLTEDGQLALNDEGAK